MVFDERLTELRKAKGLSQKECAAELNIDSSKYNKWENGKNSPDYETVCKLAKHFDVTTDYLLGLSDAKKTEHEAIMLDLGLTSDSIEAIKRLKIYKRGYPTSEEDKRTLMDVFNHFAASEYFPLILSVLRALTDSKKIEWSATQWEGEEHASVFPVETSNMKIAWYEKTLHDMLDSMLEEMRQNALDAKFGGKIDIFEGNEE